MDFKVTRRACSDFFSSEHSGCGFHFRFSHFIRPFIALLAACIVLSVVCCCWLGTPCKALWAFVDIALYKKRLFYLLFFYYNDDEDGDNIDKVNIIFEFNKVSFIKGALLKTRERGHKPIELSTANFLKKEQKPENRTRKKICKRLWEVCNLSLLNNLGIGDIVNNNGSQNYWGRFL